MDKSSYADALSKKNMANKYVKRYSTSLVTREINIKTSVKYPLDVH